MFDAGDREPLADGLPDPVENERVGGAERRDRAGLRADEPDLDGARGGGRGSDQRRRGKPEAASPWTARRRLTACAALFVGRFHFPPPVAISAGPLRSREGPESECLDERQYSFVSRPIRKQRRIQDDVAWSSSNERRPAAAAIFGVAGETRVDNAFVSASFCRSSRATTTEGGR